jgi:molecular chaperone GrpE
MERMVEHVELDSVRPGMTVTLNGREIGRIEDLILQPDNLHVLRFITRRASTGQRIAIPIEWLRRRVERERVEDRERTRLELLRQLLPLVDDLDRALAHLPPELVSHPWTQGVSLGQRRFVEALRQLGLERFGTNGDRFDPTVHEAVAYEERPDATEQLVLNVLRPGYRASGRLLRPAQVVVVGPPSQSEHPPRSNGGTRQSVATIEQNLSD